jgi:hypothetical protein
MKYVHEYIIHEQLTAQDYMDDKKFNNFSVVDYNQLSLPIIISGQSLMQNMNNICKEYNGTWGTRCDA